MTINTPFYPYRSRRRYKDGDNANSDHTWKVKSEAFGKCKSEKSPYLIANEWIAAEVAHFLRLPVPPCSLLRKKTTSTVMFASQSFEGDTAPEDTDPSVLYEKHPLLCAGIVVFDILIGNRDRGFWNIHVDDPESPTVIRLFDHERALFYVYEDEGVAQLRSRQGRLGITQSSVSNNSSHCLISLIDSHENLSHWVHRVKVMPDSFIEAVCREVRLLAITDRECLAVIEFLKTRRDTIDDLISNNHSRFPLVKKWPLFL